MYNGIIRSPQLQMPARVDYRHVPQDWSGIERAGSAIARGIENYSKQQEADAQAEALVAAGNPQVETLQRQQQATQQQIQGAQAETDNVLQREAVRFAYGTDNPAPELRTPELDAEVKSYLDTVNNRTPEQQARGLTPPTWVDPNAQTQQDYFRVGDQEFYNQPDQATLNIIGAQNKAKAVEGTDPRLAMAYEHDAQQQLAAKLQQTYQQLEQAQDVEGAVRLYSDIPDRMTAVSKRLPDGTWQVFIHPDGQPDGARLFAQGTPKDVFDTIGKQVDANSWNNAAQLQRQQARQQFTDGQAASREQQQQTMQLLTYLRQRADEAAKMGDKDSFIRFNVQAEELAARVFGGGLGGPVQGQGSMDTSGYGAEGGASPTAVQRSMQYMPVMQQEAQAAGVDPLLVAAVMSVESAGNPRAGSPAGAQGLMQFMPKTGAAYGITDPYNPQQSISAGARHLADLTKKYQGNLELALAAYNAGESAVDKHGGIPPYEETQAYVPKVLRTYNALKAQYGQGQGLVSAQVAQAPDAMGPPTRQAIGIGAMGTNFAQQWDNQPRKAPDQFSYTNEQAQVARENAEMALQASYGPKAWASLSAQEQEEEIINRVNQQAAREAPLTRKPFTPFTRPTSSNGDYRGFSAGLQQNRASQ